MHSLWELVSFQICFFLLSWFRLRESLIGSAAAPRGGIRTVSLTGGGTLCLESEIGAHPPPASGVTFLFFSLALSSPNRKSLHRLQRIVQKQTQAFFPHKAHTELGRSHKRLTGNFPWLACAPRQAPLHLGDARGISLKVAEERLQQRSGSAGQSACGTVHARRRAETKTCDWPKPQSRQAVSALTAGPFL